MLISGWSQSWGVDSSPGLVSLGEKEACSSVSSAPPLGSKKLALMIVNYPRKRPSPWLPSWLKLQDQ